MKNIVDYIKNNGKVGTITTEIYVELPDTFKITIPNSDKTNDEREELELCQLSYFSDENELLVYVLNEFDNGEFIDYNILPNNAKKKIKKMFNIV